MMKQRQPVAIVGMSGIFPGASDTQRFWDNIIQKKSAIDVVPEDRWITRPDRIISPDGKPDTVFHKKAGLIRNFRFSPDGFAIAPDLLQSLDPMYHLMLTAGREATVGVYSNREIKARTGVILAAIALPTDGASELTRMLIGKSIESEFFPGANPEPISLDRILSARVTALPAALLANALSFGGGSFTLDAACSSSLYAIKLACDQLLSGKTDMMIAGGVSRPESLFTQAGFTQLQALSPTGICAPFDASADGLVVGEGAGAVVLKRLDDAIHAGDTIYGVINGAGLSNDIGGNLLAPDTSGQVRAMTAAYKAAGWSPDEIGHIECHGTGTPVGDKIELNSLSTLWQNAGVQDGRCAVGSIKSMIGHLLTAAGIAGTIKTLMALGNKTIPPSLNFSSAPAGSPLETGPFYVPTDPEPWERKGETPRRAAMSAFGFGGINAHILVEEWDKTRSVSVNVPEKLKHPKGCDIAIIGIGTFLNNAETLDTFRKAVFNGTPLTTDKPSGKKSSFSEKTALKNFSAGSLPYGNYLEELQVAFGEFHIPPNEIPDILPQHLMMLKASAAALEDAGIEKRAVKEDMGTAIGMGFDYEATNFHLRWNLENEIEKWNRDYRLNLSPEEQKDWSDRLKAEFMPPLTASRTTGALGGIIASRVAKEFKLGGPSFILSAEENSGIRSLETGIHALQNEECNLFLCGATDLPGEIRSLVMTHKQRPYSDQPTAQPFDRAASGPLPGDGAAAVILKKLDHAIKDGDRIYAVIKGTGMASGRSETAYKYSLEQALATSETTPSSIGYYEAHGSASPDEDMVETQVLNDVFQASVNKNGPGTAIGATAPVTGLTGAVSGLISVIKTALCLYHEILPPLPGYQQPAETAFDPERFHIPTKPQYWLNDRISGPRKAVVGSITTDGNTAHIVLSGHETPSATEPARFRKAPAGLFMVTGKTETDLTDRLASLSRFAGLSENLSADMGRMAEKWFQENRTTSRQPHSLSIIAASRQRLADWIVEAESAIREKRSLRFSGPDGIHYTPDPIGNKIDKPQTGITFVYPGSGNHYTGMGHGVGLYWPEVVKELDQKTDRLKSMLLPEYFSPYRTDWRDGWEKEAYEKTVSEPDKCIIGHVSYTVLKTALLKSLGLSPEAVVSYSLGESAGYFATDVWKDRDQMLCRMEETDLFTRQLAGPCTSARKAWNIEENEDFDWLLAFVDMPKEALEKAITPDDRIAILIINTPEETVIGGNAPDLKAFIKKHQCKSILIDGVVTVHCDAAAPSSEAYKNLHRLITTPPKDIRFYGCHSGKQYEVTQEAAAESVLNQALYGFSFPEIIENAWNDGSRIFIETGPGASCTRMIDKILHDRPHLAISSCVKGEDVYLTAMKLIGTLWAEGVAVSPERLFEKSRIATDTPADTDTAKGIRVEIGNDLTGFPAPPRHRPEPVQNELQPTAQEIPEPMMRRQIMEEAEIPQPASPLFAEIKETMNAFTNGIEKTAAAHKKFLEFHQKMTATFSDTLNLQNEMLQKAASEGGNALLSDIRISKPFRVAIDSTATEKTVTEPKISPNLPPEAEPEFTFTEQSLSPQPVEKKLRPEPAFSREMCMEFAIGSIEKVLGPMFAPVDTYDVRVRLPDDPLMLVDRIVSVEGDPGSLKSGRVVTEHDVLPDAWYLDGDRAPVCISIEAGQADLFLCSYLGIDLAVKGKRSYRLLDAVAQFHSGLPKPGDTIRYEIEIDRFINQGETYLFFFRFNGFLGDQHIISMRNGCAGFFTPQEVKDSGGIVLTPEEKAPIPGIKTPEWNDLVPFFNTGQKWSLTDDQVNALRNGDAEAAFGPLFRGKRISSALAIPGGRMTLVHRVLEIDPEGGRYGLGVIRAQADIRPDDWFLTCHFVDDMVMPGTLMYECCMHTLRIFTMRMGWLSDREDVRCEPVPDVESVLKCRGPVTVETEHVYYLIEIREIGYNPEPFVIADAHMYAHEEHIVMFRNMSMKLSGITKDEIENDWNN